MNILLITLDQWRGDCLSVAGHPLLQTPHLDALSRVGVRFRQHYSQAAPCSPGRACLYTGTYSFTNRVVANGTPLDDRFDNLARAARRAGYVPTLFGYTDQAVDPRTAHGPEDPRLSTYEEVLPGFAVGLDLRESVTAWRHWLAELGHRVADTGWEALQQEPERPSEHSAAAFLTDRLLEWIDRQEGGWFAHASFLRPHPPYAAPGEWARRYHPDDVPAPIEPGEDLHPFLQAIQCVPETAAPADEGEMRHLISQYLGMVSGVDEQLGRLWEGLRQRGLWDDTWIVVTSDHGEQLGDHRLIQKVGFLEGSYHIPLIIRDPRFPAAHGSCIEAFTENVDLFPTLCEVMDLPIPLQCDGLPLTPFLQAVTPPWWRAAAHWEFDWRFLFLMDGSHPWPWERHIEQQHLTVRRTREAAYVQFGDGTWRCFDLAADPTWRTEIRAPARVLPEAQAMLTWRSQHCERTLSGLLLEGGGIGRWPEMPDSWYARRPA